jgi:hypothetical protein
VADLGVEGVGARGCAGAVAAFDDHGVSRVVERRRVDLEAVEVMGDPCEHVVQDLGRCVVATGRVPWGVLGLVPVDVRVHRCDHRVDVAAVECRVGVLHELDVR